jgi:serine/threonine-protein kinase
MPEPPAPSPDPEPIPADKRATVALPSSHAVRPPGAAPAAPPPNPEGPAVTGGGRAERYDLFGKIAQGGMGVVMHGRDPLLGREVAVKILRPEHCTDPEMQRRFLDEARITGRLQHPGVVPLYDLGRMADRRPFFAMKFVHGRTFAELLNDRATPAFDLPRMLNVFLQVCQTVAYAHSQGFVHRDLKPGNIMVGEFGEVQVMDWGLAKAVSRAASDAEDTYDVALAPTPIGLPNLSPGAPSPTDTRAGSVLGTPAYMAPEQAAGRIDRIDERCDVFGLGAILCEILTGEPPFGADELTAAFRRVVAEGGAGSCARLGGCGADPELIALAERCLARDPEDRPRNAGLVAEALTKHLAGTQERARTADLDAAEARTRAAEAGKRQKLTVGLAAALVALLLAVGAGLWGLATWRADFARRLDAAYNEALQERNEARAAGTTEAAPGQWADAERSAERAEAMLAEGSAPDELAGRIRALRAEVAPEAEAVKSAVARAARDRAMLDELERIRNGKNDVARDAALFLQAAEAYAGAFRHYGIDVTALQPAEAAASVATSAQRPRLVVALDDWVRCTNDPGLAKRLIEVVIRADPNPLRERWLKARDDPGELEKLAADPAALGLSPASLDLIAYGLFRFGRADPAIDLLRRTCRRYPADFWAHYSLAVALIGTPPGPGDEQLRCFNVALALRPDSVPERINFGAALSDRGLFAEAVPHFRRATELKPDLPLAHYNLGNALREAGDPDGAIAAFREATRLQPDYAEAYCNLGQLLKHLGRYDEAVTALRRGDELGRQRPVWPYPSAEWLRDAVEKANPKK